MALCDRRAIWLCWRPPSDRPQTVLLKPRQQGRANLRSRKEFDSLLDIQVARTASSAGDASSDHQRLTGSAMPQDDQEDPERLLSHADAWDRDEDLFNGLHVDYDEEKVSISGLRRRRRRAANSSDSPIKTVSLIEEDGVLFWRDNIPVAPPSVVDIGLRRRRLRRRAGLPLPPMLGDDAQMPDSPVVLTRTFPVLEPNKIVAAVGAIDQALNPALDRTLRSRLRRLQRINARTFRLGPPAEMPVFGGSHPAVCTWDVFQRHQHAGGIHGHEEGLDFLNRRDGRRKGLPKRHLLRPRDASRQPDRQRPRTRAVFCKCQRDRSTSSRTAAAGWLSAGGLKGSANR